MHPFLSAHPLAITARQLFDGQRTLENPVVLIDGGLISTIASQTAMEIPAGIDHLHVPDVTLATAFCDIHFHGAQGADVMDATGNHLASIGSFLAARGTSTYLATTVTAPLDATLRAVDRMARQIETGFAPGCARPIGIHLEGPFLSHAKRGVQPAAWHSGNNQPYCLLRSLTPATRELGHIHRYIFDNPQ